MLLVQSWCNDKRKNTYWSCPQQAMRLTLSTVAAVSITRPVYGHEASKPPGSSTLDQFTWQRGEEEEEEGKKTRRRTQGWVSG